MSYLALVLAAKISLTALFTAAPFLLLPAERLARMTGAGTGGATLFRLYGLAVAALLIGYASGFWAIARGEFPWGVVAMGLVSNGGAAFILFVTGAWRRSILITLFVTAITLMLVVSIVSPQRSLGALW